jgi:hypothetical protein
MEMQYIYSAEVGKLINEWKDLRENFRKMSDYESVEYCNRNLLKILQVATPLILVKKMDKLTTEEVEDLKRRK